MSHGAGVGVGAANTNPGADPDVPPAPVPTDKPARLPDRPKPRVASSTLSAGSLDRGSRRVVASAYYAQFHGHPVRDLRHLLHVTTNTPRVLLVGDSTLDNKYWVAPRAEPYPHPVVAAAFDATLVRRDLAYWLTRAFAARRAALNCAVEESSLRARGDALLEQDEAARDALRHDDVLVVSLGGNDVALVPTLPVALAVLWQTYVGGPVGRRTLRRLFRDRLGAYISRVTAGTRPRLVVVCGMYYPDEAAGVASWAAPTLRVLGYNARPRRLQAAIDRVFDDAVSQIRVDGCRVVHVPLSRALDGKTSADYVARVEPSEKGGRKMAELLRVAIEQGLAELDAAERDPALDRSTGQL